MKESTTGAVITAAGMSSRMGKFKPMLNIGSISIAQRVIATLQQAGVGTIVVVTGYQAQELERHLAGNGIIFLRNDNYETTQMFDSVCIGLRYLQGKCSRILFTPVDIPLFTARTVRALLESEEKIAIPVCGGESGHPILIDGSLIGQILEDTGEGGLKGALARLNISPAGIPVEDAGILHDADTPDDYEALLAFHNEQLIRPVVSISLAREKEFLNPEIASLLNLVEETGSVQEACRKLQISYSTGWNRIRALESQTAQPLVVRSRGGSDSRRSHLTEYGKTLLSRYAAYTASIRLEAEKQYDHYFNDLL